LWSLILKVVHAAERKRHFLASGTLDELKEKVARLVIVVLVIEFFQRALRVSYEQAQDLLYLAIGILLVSGAIYLTAPRRLEAPEPSEGSHQQNETQRSS
jgi:uncharacterized membrane protein YqhA